jgi:hypothetical protein
MTTLNTSWMWKQDDGEIWGLTVDTEKQRVEWFDGIGCACGDSFALQTAADFLAKGPRYGEPPPDVLGEIETTLRAITSGSA